MNKKQQNREPKTFSTGTMLSGRQQGLRKLCNAISTGATQFQWLILDFNTTLGYGAVMISRAAAHNPHLRCISFNGLYKRYTHIPLKFVFTFLPTGCALSSRCIWEILEVFLQNPESSPEFLDLGCNFMDERGVKFVAELATAPTSRLYDICLDSLDMFFFHNTFGT